MRGKKKGRGAGKRGWRGGDGGKRRGRGSAEAAGGEGLGDEGDGVVEVEMSCGWVLVRREMDGRWESGVTVEKESFIYCVLFSRVFLQYHLQDTLTVGLKRSMYGCMDVFSTK